MEENIYAPSPPGYNKISVREPHPVNVLTHGLHSGIAVDSEQSVGAVRNHSAANPFAN